MTPNLTHLLKRAKTISAVFQLMIAK